MWLRQKIPAVYKLDNIVIYCLLCYCCTVVVSCRVRVVSCRAVYRQFIISWAPFTLYSIWWRSQSVCWVWITSEVVRMAVWGKSFPCTTLNTSKVEENPKVKWPNYTTARVLWVYIRLTKFTIITTVAVVQNVQQGAKKNSNKKAN